MRSAVSFARGSGLETTNAYAPVSFARCCAIARPLADTALSSFPRSLRSAWRRTSTTLTARHYGARGGDDEDHPPDRDDPRRDPARRVRIAARLQTPRQAHRRAREDRSASRASLERVRRRPLPRTDRAHAGQAHRAVLARRRLAEGRAFAGDVLARADEGRDTDHVPAVGRAGSPLPRDQLRLARVLLGAAQEAVRAVKPIGLGSFQERDRRGPPASLNSPQVDPTVRS